MYIDFGHLPIAPSGPAEKAKPFRTFFERAVTLDAGEHAILAQIQLPRHAPGGLVRVRVFRDGERVPLAAAKCVMEDDGADRLLVRLQAPGRGRYRIVGQAAAGLDGVMLRLCTIVSGPVADAQDPAFDFPVTPAAGGDRSGLDCVILGTTNRCPASCVHCPTNKGITEDIPKGNMPMPLFRSIIDGLARLDYRGSVIFGLYGEPLLDPHLAERIAYMRERVPAVTALLATTAAVYDEATHGEAVALAHGIAIHMEALSPALYDRRMRPLRLSRVMPKVERLLVVARDKTHISMPTGRETIAEIGAMLDFSYRHGLQQPDFSALSNRCGEGSTFEREALAPEAAGCRPEKVAGDLIVDWDGTVVSCCFDFLRHGRQGSLDGVALEEFLASSGRQAVLAQFRAKRWAEMPACRHCRVDNVRSVQAMTQEAIERSLQHIEIPPMALRRDPAVVEREGSLVLDPGAAPAEATVVGTWGPYWELPRGRYDLVLSAGFDGWQPGSLARIEILLDLVIVAEETLTEPGAAIRPGALAFEAKGGERFELRLVTRGLGFTLDRAALRRQAGAAA